MAMRTVTVGDILIGRGFLSVEREPGALDWWRARCPVNATHTLAFDVKGAFVSCDHACDWDAIDSDRADSVGELVEVDSREVGADDGVEAPPELTQGVADFFASCTERTEWLLEPFVAKGTFTVVLGAPKSGKTFFTAWMAAVIAAKVRVVFVEEEGAREVLRDRLSPFLQPDPRLYNDSLRIIYRRNVKLDSEASIRALVQACEGAACLVLDPFVALHSRDENDAGQMGPVLQAIQQIMSACPGLAVVLIHHTRKGGSWDKADSSDASSSDARGSGCLVGAADQIISIKSVAAAQRVANEVRFWVENPDTRIGPTFSKRLAAIDLTGGTGTLTWVDDSPKDQREELLKRILEVVPSAPQSIGKHHVRAALRVKLERINEAVWIGMERGLLIQEHRGISRVVVNPNQPGSAGFNTSRPPDEPMNPALRGSGDRVQVQDR